MGAYRLSEGGHLIDRSRMVRFTFDGKPCRGFAGDTLASALLASNIKLLGRSYKLHRPRGLLAAGAEEPNALVTVGSGPEMTPNQRATQVRIHDGLVATSQNKFPSLKWDIGALNGALKPFFPAGFYYKTFIQPRAFWKHVYEPFIRQAAGLGPAPTEHDHADYEQFHHVCDVVVAGAGPAGIAAARAAAEAGARVVLCEQTARTGGRLLSDEVMIGDGDGIDWAAAQVAALEAMPNVLILRDTCVSASYDHGYTLLFQTLTEGSTPRQRLWRVRAGRVINAAGAIERPLAFADNDRPGVMLSAAVRDYAALWGVAAGRRVVVYTTNDDGYRTALALRHAGVEVAAILDSRASPQGAIVEHAREHQLTIQPGRGIARVLGGRSGVEAVETTALRGSARPGGAPQPIACDAVAMAGGWSPVVHLHCHSGGKVLWDEARSMFRPDAANAPLAADGGALVISAGAANGSLSTSAALGEGHEAGLRAAAETGHEGTAPDLPPVHEEVEGDIRPVWFTPAYGKNASGFKHFIDFQHDVTVGDIELAAREGYESVEHAKRYTTLGMATDQGKVSNINGHAILADALGMAIPEVGTTTFRPPYTPVTFGAIAGAKTRDLFKPVRRTPLHEWSEAHGAEWEPVGDWRRAYRYDAGREDRRASVNREVLAVRRSVGMLDASTLGKIIVKGPDAGAFLDMMYTNMMSSLKPGRCRYGLMCNDNGFLFDDGVVVRLDEDTFLCHTTTGGSDRVHAWFEEWLQTEWFDMKVYTANVTEQWAQIAVAGPNARKVLQRLGGDIDLSAEALPFMGLAEGHLAGMPVRVFRISFSGELSFEIATPAGYGLSLWEAIGEAGRAHDIQPYGTEALHVLRAEKGFIMIGDETDNTVTPHDLNLSWAVSKKKKDFIGKRAMMRADLTREGRKQLVGLLTEDPDVVLPDGAHAVEELREQAPMRTIGHVTSTYYSPTLDRSIAMALIEGGLGRMGEVLDFPIKEGGGWRVIRAVIADPVFYDKDGGQQNV